MIPPWILDTEGKITGCLQVLEFLDILEIWNFVIAHGKIHNFAVCLLLVLCVLRQNTLR